MSIKVIVSPGVATFMVACALLAGLPLVLSGQSFDCAKATAPVEKMICGDAELKELDGRMAALYAEAMKASQTSEQSSLREEQRGWLKTRNDCSSRNCVSYAYTQRNSRLDGLIGDARRNAATPAAAGDPARGGERLALAPGQPALSRSGTVVGDASVTYVVPGRKGQTLVVTLKSPSTSLYFNVLPAADPTAIYASATEMSGNSGSVILPADGDYRIVVYLFRNAARRGVKAGFTLSVSMK